MVKWNKETRLLNQQQSKSWKFELKDVDEPNLLKDIFPYSEVSKIVFDNKIIPISPPEDIFITDTTFRDGQQARP